MNYMVSFIIMAVNAMYIMLYQKLKRIGAKRCRGTVNATCIMRKSKFNETVPHHVWIETHNMVYDKTIFRTIIAQKKNGMSYIKFQMLNVLKMIV
jgi:hypothetical protein